MRAFRRLITRLLARRADRGVSEEITNELSFHIERRTEDNIEAGMSPTEAKNDALRRFGDIEDFALSGQAIRGSNPLWSILIPCPDLIVL